MERAAVLTILRRGAMTIPEVAVYAGVSVQLIRAWCKAERVDWRKARAQRNGVEWARARERFETRE